MDNTIVDLFQLNEHSNMTVGSADNKSTYISCIKIKGKPILPPLLNDEKRIELKKYKEKAIEIEIKLSKARTVTRNQILSDDASSIASLPPSRQSTPARPVSLNLHDKHAGQTYVLSKSKTEGSLNQYSKTLLADLKSDSSQFSSRIVDFKPHKSTLEQRLALEENAIGKNKLSKCQQSPIVEEKWYDSEQELSRWSPLKVDPLNSLKVELASKDLPKEDDTLELSLDDSQNTPETVTQSPNLLRQNSYTLLTPSPALLSYLEAQKINDDVQRSQSGRKTWDLSEAQKNWNSSDVKMSKTLNGNESSDDFEIPSYSKKNSSSLDDFSALENSIQDTELKQSTKAKTLTNNSCTSPESYASKKSISQLPKLKCKVKGKKMKVLKSVPSPKPKDKIRFKPHKSISTQNTPESVPLEMKKELSELSSLIVKMKFDHERQKKELEEKQQSEMKKLEIIFQKKEAELLSKVQPLSNKSKKSFYSQISRDSEFKEYDNRVMGDGNHLKGNKSKPNSIKNKIASYLVQNRRPHSAKDFHQLYNYDNDFSRRAKSMDFSQGNQDTDLDISFQDEFMQSKDTTINNEYVTESDSISNFSSRSSTISSENKPDLIPIVNFKKFRDISNEEYAKYAQAATKITAAARGFLTRRLLRTAHVQGLITTLKDAIICATQLHSASDIADSDIDLMRRLGRQIEAAWDAVYAVFFGTEISTQLQLIAADRERLKAANLKTPHAKEKKKRISLATRKSLDRKKESSIMSKSQASNGCTRVRMCSKMAMSYPSPYFSKKLK